MPFFTFDMLARQPHLIPVCARWEHEEWGHGSGRTMADALLAYATPQVSALPLTVVALDGQGEAIGMVSLWASDCPVRPALTPWMASLYVAPSARGQGVGSALFARAEAEARRLGIARLHLMTQHSEDHYRALGWQTFDAVDGPGPLRGAVLMRRELGQSPFFP